MAWVPTDSYGRRDDLLARLAWRNRFVAVLRLAVPLCGVLLFLTLAAQIWLANLARQYGVAGIAIDRGHLVVQTPQYTATTADGSRFTLGARQARAALDAPGVIELSAATLDYERPGQSAFLLAAEAATFDTGKQQVDIPAAMTLQSSDGLKGKATNVHADLVTHVAHASGPVSFTFANGVSIEAAAMDYDGDHRVWSFDRATVTIPGLPEAEQ
jgi:lipopolysaccharide export system protein LptC